MYYSFVGPFFFIFGTHLQIRLIFFNRKNLSGYNSVLYQINAFNRYSFHLCLLISVDTCKDVSFHAGHSEDVELLSCKPVWVEIGQPEDIEPVYID